ncbi:MAG: PEGA domain-containing protein [Steroidobacteraceae bacterium]
MISSSETADRDRASITVREPLGERATGGSVSFGGAPGEPGAAVGLAPDVVVPGAPAGVLARIECRQESFVAIPAEHAPAAEHALLLNGRRLREPLELARGDVLRVGDADVTVASAQPGRLALDVHHRVGNVTLPPLEPIAAASAEESDEDLEIRSTSSVPRAGANIAKAREAAGKTRVPGWRWIALAAVVLVAFLAAQVSLGRVTLELQPPDAKVRALDAWISWQSGPTLFVARGVRTLRAERDGYRPAEERVTVAADRTATLKLRLIKLPGRLDIDTGGIAANVLVDGETVGRAPGVVSVGAGERTIVLRAERFLDYQAKLDIDGAGMKQALVAKLRPSWGRITVTSDPAGALVSVNGRAVGVAPRSIDLPAGVQRVEIAAPGLRSWSSSVVVRAGESVAIGPVKLGLAYARLLVRSQPVGAEVSIAGSYRGKTPLSIELAPGLAHEVVVTRSGYTNWTRSVLVESGRNTVLDVRLAPIAVGLSVRGEPADAEVLIDGTLRGKAPLALELTAGEHRVEIRKEGLAAYSAVVPVAPGLVRTLEYRLLAPGRTQPPTAPGASVRAKAGLELKMIAAGTYDMGSDRREQGRRPNEQLRKVTLSKPFLLGVRPVSNADFRKFRPEHESGFVEKKTVDLDEQPVTKVLWEEAAEYCNWLSEQEGLPAAYEKSNGGYVLKRPVNTGYRLPTEAEWEYAARVGTNGKLRRFPWGDQLPIPAGAGNFGGAEALGLIDVALDGYRDDYPAIAPVGRFAPNPLGLYDMGANVAQWANDLYTSYVDSGAVTDPTGPAEGKLHVIRGASWRSGSVTELRLAWREGASDASQWIGFRVARTPEP